MPRKRERFERSDVPRDNPHRNLIALAVLLVIAAAGFTLVDTLWSRVKVESHMDDPDIAEAIGKQDGPTALEGDFYYTDNDIEKILFLHVDDAGADRPQLVGAQLLLIDEAGGTAHLVDVPITVRVSAEGSVYAFAEYFNSYGFEAAIPLITASFNLYANHVIMGTESPWPPIIGLAGTNPFDVVGTNPEFVENIRTDMGGGELVEHGALFQTLGVGSLEVEECPVAGEEANEDGEVTQVSVDLVPFGLQTGILIANE